MGFLFINGTLSEHYLAFSDNKADDDEDFIQWGRQDNHFYCTYNFEQLRKLSPLDILNPDLKIVSPLKLEERQKKYQTCAERKIITCVHERHKSELSNSEINETKRELSLVLLTKLTPCEFCQLLIAKQQKLQIKVLSCNYLWLILDCVKEIPNNTENYESTFDNIKGILEFIGYNLQSENSNSQSVKQTGTQQVTNVKTPNKDNKDNENRQLYPYAQRLCNNLRKEGEGPYTMKTVLKSLTTKDNHALPEKAIEQLIGANSSEEK